MQHGLSVIFLGVNVLAREGFIPELTRLTNVGMGLTVELRLLANDYNQSQEWCFHH